MNYSIYLVEDESDLNEVLTTYLEREGWAVKSFTTGDEAEKYIHDTPNMWILDIMLPGVNGYELLKKIKAHDSNIPVIFISARDAELERVIGLEMGCDDYISKPFLPRELIVRVKNLLGRIVKNDQAKDSDNIYIGEYHIDLSKRIVLKNGNIVELTSKEFDLLEFFVKNKMTAFTREQILKQVWGEDYFGSDRVVDDLVRRLRKQCPNIGIETIYGHGYRMVND